MKKVLLMAFFGLARYGAKVGVIEDTSIAFLVYAAPITWMCMMGRVLQGKLLSNVEKLN